MSTAICTNCGVGGTPEFLVVSSDAGDRGNRGVSCAPRCVVFKLTYPTNARKKKRCLGPIGCILRALRASIKALVVDARIGVFCLFTRPVSSNGTVMENVHTFTRSDYSAGVPRQL